MAASRRSICFPRASLKFSRVKMKAGRHQCEDPRSGLVDGCLDSAAAGMEIISVPVGIRRQKLPLATSNHRYLTDLPQPRSRQRLHQPYDIPPEAEPLVQPGRPAIGLEDRDRQPIEPLAAGPFLGLGDERCRQSLPLIGLGYDDVGRTAMISLPLRLGWRID